MAWHIEFLQEAVRDLERLDNSHRQQALRVLNRVATNPLPNSEGGYGKPLGNTTETKLAGLLKIKLRSSGVRIVYVLIREKKTMRVIVVSVRDDGLVYKQAHKRHDQ